MLRDALGDSKLIINNPGIYRQAAANGLMFECFDCTGDMSENIESLQRVAEAGVLAEVHVNVWEPGTLAAFLAGMGKYSYFGTGGWNGCGSNLQPHIEYERPLGEPVGSAT